MKETADIFYDNNFSGIARKQRKKATTFFLLTLKKILSSFKQELLTGLATLWIGTVFLCSIYLFFTQLAKYGW